MKKTILTILTLVVLLITQQNCYRGFAVPPGSDSLGSGIGPSIPCNSPLCPTPGSVTSYSSPNSIGIEWPVTGDTNHNAKNLISYRVTGTSSWKKFLPLMRIDSNDQKGINFNGFAGSIMFLQPGTSYDVQLTIEDSDGGLANQMITVTTKSFPSKPTGGRTFYMSPGTGGGTGTAASPFLGIEAAEAAVQPGDIVNINSGNYAMKDGSTAYFHKSGTPQNYIVWQALPGSNVVFQGPNNAGTNLGSHPTNNSIFLDGNYIWLEGVTVQNAVYGLNNPGPAVGLVISRCNFLNNHEAIILHGGADGWFILDNTFVGDYDIHTQYANDYGKNSNYFDGGTFFLGAAPNMVIAYNSITRSEDAIYGAGKNSDIYGNDVLDISDDFIENDDDFYGLNYNVRAWQNRLRNATNGFSFQPQDHGPWYFIRNELVGVNESMLKQRNMDRSYILHNNFVNYDHLLADLLPNYPVEDETLQNFMKNNLWVAVSGGRIFDFSKPGLQDWRTEIDYNAYDWGNNPNPFQIMFGNTGTSPQAKNFPDLASFGQTFGVEAHGLRFDKSACFNSLNVPGAYPTAIPLQDLRLKAGCPLIDAGVSLAGINDDFTGTAPDIGAYEFGKALPHYGPR